MTTGKNDPTAARRASRSVAKRAVNTNGFWNPGGSSKIKASRKRKSSKKKPAKQFSRSSKARRTNNKKSMIESMLNNLSRTKRTKFYFEAQKLAEKEGLSFKTALARILAQHYDHPGQQVDAVQSGPKGDPVTRERDKKRQGVEILRGRARGLGKKS